MVRFSRIVFLSLLLAWAGAAGVHAIPTGDFNSDALVDVTDAVSVLRSAAGLHAASAEEVARADLSADGQMDVKDAVWILQIAAGLRPPVVVPNPLSITVRTDETKAASATIGTAGGTLTTTAADGTKYTLVIPEKALLSDERITLTPVTAVERLPLSGGLVGAATFEPEGLRLLQFATLTIEPTAMPPVSEQVGFAFHGGGEEFHLAPLSIKPALELKLIHFSGAGVGRGTEADQEAARQHAPSTAEDRLVQQIEEIISRERESQLLGEEGDPDFWEKLEPLPRAFYWEVIRPLLERAVTDDALAPCAISKYLGWLRQLLLLGIISDESNEGYDREIREADALVEKIVRNVIEKSYQRCTEGHDLSQAVKLLSAARQAELMGGSLSGGYTSEQLMEMVDKCLTFELEFESVIEGQQGGTTESGHVRARVPVRADLTNGLVGEAPLEYVKYAWEDNPPVDDCTHQGSGTGETFRVISGTINLNMRQTPETDCTNPNAKPPAEEQKEPGVTLTVHPGQTHEIHTVTCDGESFSSPGTYWSAVFDEFHEDERSPVGYVLTGWGAGTGSLLARKTYQRTRAVTRPCPAPNCTVNYTETTILNLWHRPQ